MFKLKVGIFAALIGTAMLTVSVAYGGVLWSGIDPVFSVNNTQYHVSVYWPQGYDCYLQRPINVNVNVPADAEVSSVTESSGNFPCGIVNTLTTISSSNAGRDRSSNSGNSQKMIVTALFNASQEFPVKVEITGGPSTVTCYGATNQTVQCAPISLK